MLYRTIPKNGDSLSILGFGCMRLPLKNGNIDETRAIRQIRHAIDRGVNYVDTAWPYHAGESEPLLAKALKDGYRERVKLATKLPSWMIARRQDMDRYLAAQLNKLCTGQIDYYLLHALNGMLWDTLAELGVRDFLNQAKADGRIVNAGFSFHGLAEDFKRIVDAHDWDFCQIQYNFLDQKNQAGTAGMEYAAARGMGVIIMEPLRGGSLGLSPPPPAINAIWNAAGSRRTPAAWALRWVWNHPEVTVVLSGMNNEAHIDENLSIADQGHANVLGEEELQVVERVACKYRELMKVNCTGCGYCMPCPSDVMIPTCFELYNSMHMFGNADVAKFSYAVRMSGEFSDGRSGYASQCVQCGECLEKCPQGIQIPDALARVTDEMEGPELERRLASARQVLRVEAK
jgi:uncharacterized protein